MTIDSISASFTAPFYSNAEQVKTAYGLIPVLPELVSASPVKSRLPDTVMEALSAAGLLNLHRPKKFGGRPIALNEGMQVSRMLAKADGSIGWVHTVVTTHEHMIHLFPEDVQARFWTSSTLPLCASSYMPTGKATPVDGGYILNGKWSYCSGTDFAGWTIVGAIVPPSGAGAAPDLRLFLVPKKNYRTQDDWAVMGLRGTGSKSIIIEDVFVEEHYSLRDADIRAATTPGARAAPENAFRYSAWTLLAFALSGIATGIAYGAVEASLDEFKARAQKPDPLFLAREPAIRIGIAEATSLIDASDLVFMRAMKETYDLVETGGELTIARRVRNRRDQCFSVDLAKRGVAQLLEMSGARGIKESEKVQRAYRDILAVSAHPGTIWDSTALSYGSVALGGQPTEYYY